MPKFLNAPEWYNDRGEAVKNGWDYIETTETNPDKLPKISKNTIFYNSQGFTASYTAGSSFFPYKPKEIAIDLISISGGEHTSDTTAIRQRFIMKYESQLIEYFRQQISYIEWSSWRPLQETYVLNLTGANVDLISNAYDRNNITQLYVSSSESDNSVFTLSGSSRGTTWTLSDISWAILFVYGSGSVMIYTNNGAKYSGYTDYIKSNVGLRLYRFNSIQRAI